MPACVPTFVGTSADFIIIFFPILIALVTKRGGGVASR